MAIFSPTSWLSKVDLPTLGAPTIEMKPDLNEDSLVEVIGQGHFFALASLCSSPEAALNQSLVNESWRHSVPGS